jgi:hypothetical protein
MKEKKKVLSPQIMYLQEKLKDWETLKVTSDNLTSTKEKDIELILDDIFFHTN